MKETGLSLEKVVGAPSLFAGGSMRSLGELKLGEIATVASSRLERHASTMIQYPPDALLQSIGDSRTACVLDSKGVLTAFAQYWPYEVDNTGDEILRDLNVFEIGSWLSFDSEKEKGNGRKVFEAAWEVGQMKHPNAGFVAIVEEGNVRAADILRLMGGEKIGEKVSKHIKYDVESPARMSIYRMLKPNRGK